MLSILFYSKVLKMWLLQNSLNKCYRWWHRTSPAGCVHNAVVPNAVRDVAAAGVAAEDLGLDPAGWQ